MALQQLKIKDYNAYVHLLSYYRIPDITDSMHRRNARFDHVRKNY